MELSLTGDPIDAETAYRYGLVNRLTDADAALDGALALAETISANGPLALAATKQIVRDATDWTMAEAWGKQGKVMAPVFGSEDAREGAAAFAEKRAPVWKGK
jgi:enoyl-CoA hydratase